MTIVLTQPYEADLLRLYLLASEGCASARIMKGDGLHGSRAVAHSNAPAQ